MGNNFYAVVGAGSWGTALANLLASNGKDVLIWAYDIEVANEINLNHTNSNYLNIQLDKKLKATTNIEDLSPFNVWINTIPTQFIRENFSAFKNIPSNLSIVNCSKGIEFSTQKLISDIFKETIGLSPENYAVLTGPSHAEEVAIQTPTTVVCASKNNNLAKDVQSTFSNSYFRVYTSTDVVGSEIGGALKNIIAIAAGVSDGMKLGDNPKAALMTRGLVEIRRLSEAYHANPLTFSGLAGLGDLIVTCNSRHSRNRSVGEEIAKGKSLDDLKKNKMIAEGIATTKAVYDLANKLKIEMPITEQVYKILYEGKSPIDGIKDLMNRSTKQEWW